MELYLGLLIILTAYFIKGFSGFGPALIIVPFFTILYDAPSALLLAAVFDMFAGATLIHAVRKEMDWRFVLTIFTVLGLGTIVGSSLLGYVSVGVLKKLIGAVIFIFSLVILFQRNGELVNEKTNHKKFKYPASFLSGFLGGLVGMSGPPLIIYMKLNYPKAFFRAQLIGIFFLGTAWRSLLFIYHEIPMNIPYLSLIIFFLLMFIGLWLGGKLHIKVNETTFNKIVALILFIPAFSLLLS
jgi:uncharacterized membrane protein YfcA